MSHTYIIAEAGVNHNGSLEKAIQLIDVAADAGTDAVKFQTFRAEALVSKIAPKAEYQIQTTGAKETQFEMLKKLELNEEHHEKLIQYTKSKRIEFLSTPFDMESLYLLTERFKIKKIKVPSGEITNAPFLLEISRSAEQIILSTGMSTLAEIELALGVIAFGFVEKRDVAPSFKLFSKSFASIDGQRQLRERVVLLHATTEYPAPYKEINLKAMDTMRYAFGLPVGYSDHTEGIHIPVAAVARGATMIEKHFTLDRNLPGPDHKASLQPEELKQMVKSIRDVEIAMGDGIKRPTSSEWKNMDTARKSLVANEDIALGEMFSAKNIATKRPGIGVSPSRYWEYLGKKADRNFKKDDLIL